MLFLYSDTITQTNQPKNSRMSLDALGIKLRNGMFASVGTVGLSALCKVSRACRKSTEPFLYHNPEITHENIGR